nr:mannose-1-phosphate guanylyltransferase [Nanchangia anserum]
MHVVIPAGGAGTRLWPLSRQSWPKYLLEVERERSLLRAAIERVEPLAADVCVVTSPATARLVAEQVDGAAVPTEVMAEPSPKNSMPAIGLAAAIIEYRHGRDALVGSFAADHAIADEQRFRRVVSEAMRAADHGWIVTIGITPTHPATGYGYIETGASIDGLAARGVTSFTEKPDATRAGHYLARGGYLWNAGMFIARCGVLLDALAEEHPEMARGLRALARLDRPSRQANEIWDALPAIAIDHAVAEPQASAGRVAVCEAGDIGWSDVGDYAALAECTRDADGIARVGDITVTGIDAPGSLAAASAASQGEHVIVCGIPDAIVVRAGDTTLVTTRAWAGRIREVRERASHDRSSE